MAKAQSFECALPTHQSDKKRWREQILKCARTATGNRTRKWSTAGPLEVVVLLYLDEGKRLEKNDVDNRLKDVLDGCKAPSLARG